MAMQHKAIDDFCRLCAIESQSGIIIYSSEGESLCLEEKIISCLRIEVSRDDLLPKKVCQLCSELLDDYHRFSERAMQVQQTLGLLLGIHAPCIPPDEMQLDLMQTDVKIESNVIKNELDDLTMGQGNIQIDNEKFDLSLGVQLANEYHTEEIRRKLVLDNFDEAEAISHFNYEDRDLTDFVVDNVRQMHRRKLAQPKKASSCEVLMQDKFEIQDDLKDTGEVDCLISNNNNNNNNNININININNNGNQTNFKSEASNDCDLFQDLSDCPKKDEDLKLDENVEELSASEKEWGKYWGIMCNQCSGVFPNRTAFDNHYKFYYNKKPVYTCSYCKESIEKYSEYRFHTLKHISEGQFKCKYCDTNFCTEEMLQVHSVTHNGRGGSFVYEDCGLECANQKKLNSHKKKHNSQNQKEFRCPECGKVLQTRGGLTAHLTVHKLGRRFMCHICGKTFTQKINMQQHVKHHKGEKPYTCEDCGKSFTEKSHLNRHKSFHTLERPYQCSVCKKMYKTERCLKVHSHVHLNTRPYVCTYCGKGFLSSTKLKQHYNCHTGERPFACKYCERAFTNYPNWLKHTRRRHKVDHKTGLSLKEESQPQNVPQTNGNPNEIFISNEGIVSEIEVKDDGESIQPLVSDVQGPMSQDLMTDFQEPANNFSGFQLNPVPELFSHQNIYPVQVSSYFRSCFKEI